MEFDEIETINSKTNTVNFIDPPDTNTRNTKLIKKSQPSKEIINAFIPYIVMKLNKFNFILPSLHSFSVHTPLKKYIYHTICNYPELFKKGMHYKKLLNDTSQDHYPPSQTSNIMFKNLSKWKTYGNYGGYTRETPDDEQCGIVKPLVVQTGFMHTENTHIKMVYDGPNHYNPAQNSNLIPQLYGTYVYLDSAERISFKNMMQLDIDGDETSIYSPAYPTTMTSQSKGTEIYIDEIDSQEDLSSDICLTIDI